MEVGGPPLFLPSEENMPLTTALPGPSNVVASFGFIVVCPIAFWFYYGVLLARLPCMDPKRAELLEGSGRAESSNSWGSPRLPSHLIARTL